MAIPEVQMETILSIMSQIDRAGIPGITAYYEKMYQRLVKENPSILFYLMSGTKRLQRNFNIPEDAIFLLTLSILVLYDSIDQQIEVEKLKLQLPKFKEGEQ